MAKKLKDVNKDGKVNFKDTWLGERLSTKGKLKGPNLAESLKGARREVPGEEKKPSASTKPESSQKKKKVTATAKASGSVVPTGTASAKAKVNIPAKPETKESVGRTSMKVPKGITYEQWKGMTRTERREANLPVSAIGGELAFNRFLSGITGEDYKIGGEAEVKKPKGVEVKRPPRPGFKTQTYAKGGMTKGSK
jgi:hypothetical protein